MQTFCLVLLQKNSVMRWRKRLSSDRVPPQQSSDRSRVSELRGFYCDRKRYLQTCCLSPRAFVPGDLCTTGRAAVRPCSAPTNTEVLFWRLLGSEPNGFSHHYKVSFTNIWLTEPERTLLTGEPALSSGTRFWDRLGSESWPTWKQMENPDKRFRKIRFVFFLSYKH